MKKLLTMLGALTIVTSSTMGVVSCQTGSGNWNDIPVDPPVLALDVKGFAGVNFKDVNPQDNNQTIPMLFAQLAKLFQGTKWDFNALHQQIKFNGSLITNPNPDLYRNGEYNIVINDNTSENELTINKTVVNSNHIADKVKNLDLGIVDDARPKTLLIATVFNNMGLISEIDKFGTFFIGEETEAIWNQQITSVPRLKIDANNGTAILETGKDHWTDHDDPHKDYYGTVTVHFTVKSKQPPANPMDLTNSGLSTNLGKLPQVSILQIMMMFITLNFAGSLDKLSELLNDLYVKNITNNSADIEAWSGSKYFSGALKVNFS
ncbi:lipoprotein [Spiroplasma sp. DGKH1]|uniref:lipoprotein n=1 Tax=Spiroplasma sp. DGKH1 TaxID=3050074 RepID=UPI0034C6328E